MISDAILTPRGQQLTHLRKSTWNYLMITSSAVRLCKPIRLAALLPVLVFTFLVSGCSGKDAVAPVVISKEAFDDFREAITDTIEDPERQKTVLLLVDDYESDYATFLGAVDTQRTELRRLNADYDASREQFQSYFDKYNADIRSARKEATKSRTAFIESTTAEEWDALGKADSKTMKKLVSSIQSL